MEHDLSARGDLAGLALTSPDALDLAARAPPSVSGRRAPSVCAQRRPLPVLGHGSGAGSTGTPLLAPPARAQTWRGQAARSRAQRGAHRPGEAGRDDLYRVARVDYQHDGGDDPWTSPFAAENSGAPDLQDPRRAKPSPHVDFPKRLAWQTFEYDWLGNTKKTDDDAHGFYDRSLGPITNDTYRLASADNTTTGGSKTGKLETRYDAAGNLTRLQVKRNGTCLPAGADCSQVFAYTWDEVGRLTRARRWDVAALPAIADPPPTDATDAELAYAYDAGDQRVLKTAGERHTVYVFESLELRRAAFAPGPGPSEVPDYELSKWTETAFLFAHGVRLARVAWDQPDVPTIGGAETHVFLELGDHLGSTSVVLDKATGELVERGTWQAYGGAESDFRPERWKGFREDYGFTGKESDVEVGLVYFGKRFLSTSLNQWVSADPLAVHGLGADSNVYAFVSGSPLKNVDPLGLCDSAHPCGPEQGAEGTGSGGPAMESEFVRWNQELIAARAETDRYAQELIESRDMATSQTEAQARGWTTVSDGTPQIRAAAAKQKAAEGLATMTVTTPFAPVVVSLQAATGNNDAAVVANHLGIIGSAALTPHSQPYTLSLRDLQPPRVDARPAMEGPVVVRPPPGATPAEIQQMSDYCALCNQAISDGRMSPTGRVSTAGRLRAQASRDAALIRKAAEEAGVPFKGHVGHTPDTTWTGKPQAPDYLDLTPRVNMSLGGQASRYPVGYKPTVFVLELGQ